MAEILKRYLFSLTEPLLSYELYDSFQITLSEFFFFFYTLKISQYLIFTNNLFFKIYLTAFKELKDQLIHFYELITALQPQFYEPLKLLLQLFTEICSTSKELTSQKLAEIFTRCFCSPSIRLYYMENDVNNSQTIVKLLIDNYEVLFSAKGPKATRYTVNLGTKHAVMSRAKTKFAEEYDKEKQERKKKIAERAEEELSGEEVFRDEDMKQLVVEVKEMLDKINRGAKQISQINEMVETVKRIKKIRSDLSIKLNSTVELPKQPDNIFVDDLNQTMKLAQDQISYSLLVMEKQLDHEAEEVQKISDESKGRHLLDTLRFLKTELEGFKWCRKNLA